MHNFFIPKSKNEPFYLIAGPCVIESEDAVLEIARYLKELTLELGIPYVFKASFDKANRSSIDSYRGPGLIKGLEILQRVRNELNLPIVTDVHDVSQVESVAKVVDIIQIPAFLCRQTDLLVAVAKTNKVVNVKKGQFIAPNEIPNILEKIKASGNNQILITERGTSFGYNNLVVDIRSLPIMREQGVSVIFDATHSVQMPGGNGKTSGGQRQYVSNLARAAVATGIDGLFIETHPNPDKALCDGPNMFPLSELSSLLRTLKQIDQVVKGEK